jgi:hypothetical protein
VSIWSDAYGNGVFSLQNEELAEAERGRGRINSICAQVAVMMI